MLPRTSILHMTIKIKRITDYKFSLCVHELSIGCNSMRLGGPALGKLTIDCTQNSAKVLVVVMGVGASWTLNDKEALVCR